MGNAASMFNLMRNVGSSIGIAVVTTDAYSPSGLPCRRLSASRDSVLGRGRRPILAQLQSVLHFKGR